MKRQTWAETIPLSSIVFHHLTGIIAEPFILFIYLPSAPKPGKRLLALNSRRDEWSGSKVFFFSHFLFSS